MTLASITSLGFTVAFCDPLITITRYSTLGAKVAGKRKPIPAFSSRNVRIFLNIKFKVQTHRLTVTILVER
uniref:Putative secreted protein n=1 Tax=Anopheles darlingi TaxID=43151 RepID=A0A2M4DPW1_ANODA